MATILEELAIRLGIDQSQVAPALDEFKKMVNDANQKAKRSFLDVGTASGSFKKILTELSSQSPLLGTALKLALNPIVGILTAATLAFNKFIEKQKEATAEAQRYGKAAASSQVNMLEAAYSDDPQKARRAAALSYARERASKSVEDFMPEGMKLAEKKYTKNQLEIWGFKSTPGFKDQALIAANQLREQSVARYEAMLKQKREEEEQLGLEKQYSERLDAEEKVGRKLAEAAAIERANKRETITIEQRLVELTSDKLSLRREIELGEDDEMSLAEKRVELAKKETEILKTKEEIAKRTGQQQKELSEYEASRARIQASKADDFKLDVDKLKTHGQWIYDRRHHRSYWRASPAAEQAQRIDWLENESYNQRAWGNIRGAEGLLSEAGRLRSQLVEAKILKPDPADVLLSALDSKKAFKVSVQNLD